MRRYLCTLLLLLPLQAFATACFQGEAYYFRPTSSTLREIYGSAWCGGKVVGEGNLSDSKWYLQRIYLFGEVGYLDKDGTTAVGGYDTTIRIIPLTLGLKWIQPLKGQWFGYIGAGPRYFFMRIKDSLAVVKPRTYKNGCGGVVMVGSKWFFARQAYLDTFLSYDFKRFSAPSTPTSVTGHSLEIGGLQIGGGFGFSF